MVQPTALRGRTAPCSAWLGLELHILPLGYKCEHGRLCDLILGYLDGESQARDVFAALKDAALKVSMKISYVSLGQAREHPMILPSDFVLALTQRNRLALLLPDTTLDSSACVLEEYWRRFKLQFGADHDVFSHVPPEHLSSCVPIKIHGDEGRSLLATASVILTHDFCAWTYVLWLDFAETRQEEDAHHAAELSAYLGCWHKQVSIAEQAGARREHEAQHAGKPRNDKVPVPGCPQGDL